MKNNFNYPKPFCAPAIDKSHLSDKRLHDKSNYGYLYHNNLVTRSQTMIRQPYIRFFISSTFADMDNERTALRRVFERLKRDYAAKGWTIEDVDLRWGISPEMQRENRTMQVCLDELARCRELSPKPNFILLLGQRYGWSPLPETLSVETFCRLKSAASNDYEVRVLEQAYRYDNNALPSGEYVLLPKEQGDDRYETEVVRPLTFLMKRARVDLITSATEREISNGVLCDDDAADHVVAYFRQLVDIPDDQRATFVQRQERVVALQNKIRCQIPDIISEKLPFDQLNSFDRLQEFEHAMEQRLRRLIDREIDRVAAVKITDNDRHIDVAQHLSADFAGRGAELARLRDYVDTPNSSGQVLWLHDERGTGKTALMAALTTELARRDDVELICRFCEDLPADSAEDFLMSLGEDLCPYYNRKNIAAGWLDVDNILGRNLYTFEEGLLFTGIKSPKTVAILLDGLDAIESDTDVGLLLRNLNWVIRDKQLEANVKVIITTDSGSGHRPEVDSLFRKMDLPHLCAEAAEFTDAYLAKHGRRLTDEQRLCWLHTVGIYEYHFFDAAAMAISVDGLTRMHSWQNYEAAVDNRFEFGLIVKQFIERTVASGELPEVPVKTMLRMLASARIGVPEHILLAAMARTPQIRDYVSSLDHHRWDERYGPFPPIIWSRILYVLRPIVTIRPSLAGLSVMFKSASLAALVREWWGTDVYELYVLAGSNFADERWSLYEMPHLLTVLAGETADDDELGRSFIAGESLAAVRDFFYIGNKMTCFGKRIADDFDAFNRLYPAYTDEASIDPAVIKSVQALRNEIMSLPRPRSADHFIAMIAGLDSGCEASRLLRKDSLDYPEVFDRWLVNKMDIGANMDYVVSSTGRLGNFAVTDLTGKRIACVDVGQLVIKDLERVTQHTVDLDIDRYGQVRKLVSDRTLRKFVVIYDNASRYGYVSDSGTSYIGDLPVAPVQWADFSPDGTLLVVGGKDIPTQVYSVNKAACVALLKFSQCFSSGMFSDSGLLWATAGKQLYLMRLHPFAMLHQVSVNCDMVVSAVTDRQAVFTTVDAESPQAFCVDLDTEPHYYGFGYSEDGSLVTGMAIDKQPGQMAQVYRFYDNGAWIKNTRLPNGNVTFDGGSTFPVSSARRGLHRLLSRNREIVFDFARCAGMSVVTTARVAGVNTLAVDHSGCNVAVTYGKNRMQECYTSFPLFRDDGDGRYCRFSILSPFGETSTCAVSDDGKHFAFGSAGRIFIGDTATRQLIQAPGYTLPHTHMKFTPDNLLVAVSGDYITDSPAVCRVVTVDGRDVMTINDDSCRLLMRMEFLMSPDGRFIMLDWGGAFDLKAGKPIVCPDDFRPELRKPGNQLGDDLFPFGAFSSDSRSFYTNHNGHLTRMDMLAGQIETVGPSLRVLSLSADGRALFCCDSSDTIVRFDLATHRITRLPLTNVFKLFLCDDNRHFYVVTFDNEIKYCSADGNVLQSVACSGRRYALCRKGLAVVVGDGQVCLFGPAE